MPLRYSLAVVMTASLSWNPAAARPTVMGVVIEAKRARLNSAAVTAGATVFDGDRFSTEAGGSLRVQNSMTMLKLAESSVVNMRSLANGAQGIEAELEQGTLLFNTAQTTSLNVIARGASFRPIANALTFAQIGIASLNELRVCAQRGGLQISYRGEIGTIAEGNCYRVILGSSSDSPNEKKPRAPGRQPKALKIVIIGESAAVVGLGIYELHEPESPDRP
ncbi:MAG TPA: hypothetical protein VJN89_17240 [Candidatus Acidoferrum sp.]|nr:hypothetical protein [Candidatus Acidoferrum sp.]